jgi:hypothetical protein
MKKLISTIAIAASSLLLMGGTAQAFTYGQAVNSAISVQKQECGQGLTWWCASPELGGVAPVCNLNPSGSQVYQWYCTGQIDEENIWLSFQYPWVSEWVSAYGGINNVSVS